MRLIPSYHTHILSGAGATASILYLTETNIFTAGNELLGLYVITVTVIFSILPDIDHKASKASKYLHIAMGCVLVWMIFFNHIKLSISTITLLASITRLELYHRIYAIKGVHHRQFPHTVTFTVIITFVLWMISQSWLITLIGGVCYLLHLLLDSKFIGVFRYDKRLWKKEITKIFR